MSERRSRPVRGRSIVVAEITEAGLAALGVRIGDEVWASVQASVLASEITVVADS